MEAGIHLVVRTMIASYGVHAAASAANRARVLEACGDRDTSRYWDLVREQIDDFDRFRVLQPCGGSKPVEIG